MRVYGYARVSSKEQHLDRQIEALKKFGIEERNIIQEKASGKDLNRPNYQVLRNALLREGDVLVVTSLDRLSRNKDQIKSELEYYHQRHVRVEMLDLPTTLVDLPAEHDWVIKMVNQILVEVISSLAQQERHMILQRQKEGIAAAHAKGKKFGRPEIALPANFQEEYSKVLAHEQSATKAMQKLGLRSQPKSKDCAKKT